MSLVVVAGDAGRWPLGHGQDPVDLLAEHGWEGTPVRAALDADGRIEVHYSVTALADPVTSPARREGAVGARVLQRTAAYALVLDDDRLLMSRLAEWVRGAGGLWTLPGGGIDPGEEPHDAVVREVHEETGQHVEVGDLVQVQSMHWVDEGEDFHAVRMVYLADCPHPTQAHVVEVDGSTGAAAWVPLERVPELPRTGMVDVALPHLPGEGDADEVG